MYLVAGLILLVPLQARADLTYTMTAFQSLGEKYASGEIIGTLTGDMNVSPLYSFCVDASSDLNQNTPYTGTLSPIAGNNGLIKSAYLMHTYVPRNNVLTDMNTGVALQWAIWELIGQGHVITDNGLDTKYSTIYTQAGNYAAEAQNATNLSQYAAEYKVLQLQDSQNLLFVHNSGTGITPVPVPTAAYLFGSGLLGLLGLRRKAKS
jgi:hypothetical protein